MALYQGNNLIASSGGNGQAGGMDVIELTYDEYQAIENKDSGTLYIVTDKSLSGSGDNNVVSNAVKTYVNESIQSAIGNSIGGSY